MYSYLEALSQKPYVISILNQKGGCGKTTVAVNLAHGLSMMNLKVLLVDGDPQGSARDWNEANEASIVPVVGLDRDTLPKDLDAIKAGYHIIIIDGAPQIAKLSAAAIRASDLVVIPVQPSPYDVWATADLVELIKARQSVANGKPNAAFLLSRVIKNTQLSKDVHQPLKEYDLPILNASISQYVLYPTSAAKGETVFSKGENLAASEMNNLIQEIIARYVSRVSL